MTRMFSSVLIANRGEIACRVIRTARRMGLRTIAVYSIGRCRSAPCRASPMRPIPSGRRRRARAIFAPTRSSRSRKRRTPPPFIRATASFPRMRNSRKACADAGIIFVGPPASAIRAMGLKDAAKALVEKAGVPVVPGYHGARQDPDFLRQKAYETGYPVLIKAVAGGGGKGMRRVDRQQDFDAALAIAQREAASAFGDRARAHREIHPLAAPYRDPGFRRCPWPCRSISSSATARCSAAIRR